jgi:hypothetical protein
MAKRCSKSGSVCDYAGIKNKANRNGRRQKTEDRTQREKIENKPNFKLGNLV